MPNPNHLISTASTSAASSPTPHDESMQPTRSNPTPNPTNPQHNYHNPPTNTPTPNHNQILQKILSMRLKMSHTLHHLNQLSQSQNTTVSPFLKIPPHLYEVLEHQNLSASASASTTTSTTTTTTTTPSTTPNNNEDFFEEMMRLIREACEENTHTDTPPPPSSASPSLTLTTNLPPHPPQTQSPLYNPFKNIWNLIGTDWPKNSVPIRADVTNFEWDRLAKFVKFDVVMMDPPWQLASSNPTRGVALAYAQLSDSHIQNLPMHLITQPDSFLFLWVINAKYQFSLNLIRQWGYRFVDEITWVKHTKNRRLAKSHGYYLQHAKESCLVAVKGNPSYNRDAKISDVIFSERRAQSQKPSEIYSYIEELLPGGRFLEIFGRKNNLRSGWVTIGNEI